MAAHDNVMLENYVKLFVETKVAEYITLEFATGYVYIRPKAKTGSTTLGAFWVRVLQSYFPRGQFNYKKHYSTSVGSEAITVKVEGYTLTIYLRTGLLTIEGDLAYEWFRVVFRKIMQSYDEMTGANPSDYFNDQVVFDIRKELKKPRRSDSRITFTEPEIVDPKVAFVSSEVRLSESRMGFLNDRFLDLDEGRTPDDMSLVSKEIPSSGLGTVALKDGERFIYPMWKQLLNKWLGKESCKVYVCTSHIDLDRLRDIVSITYKNKLVMNLEAIYTEPVIRNGQHMAQVKEKLLRGHTADEQLFIEYRIINKMLFPTTKSISCNFIAGEYNGVVEVMITSAAFDLEGMVKPNTLSSVTVTKMLREDFRMNFLDKLSTV